MKTIDVFNTIEYNIESQIEYIKHIRKPSKIYSTTVLANIHTSHNGASFKRNNKVLNATIFRKFLLNEMNGFLSIPLSSLQNSRHCSLDAAVLCSVLRLEQ